MQPAGPTPAAPRDNIKAQRATSVLFSGQCMAFVSSTAHCAQCACSALAFVAARVQCKQLEQGRLSAFLSGGERSNGSVEGVAIVAAAGHSSAILPPQSDPAPRPASWILDQIVVQSDQRFRGGGTAAKTTAHTVRPVSLPTCVHLEMWLHQ